MRKLLLIHEHQQQRKAQAGILSRFANVTDVCDHHQARKQWAKGFTLLVVNLPSTNPEDCLEFLKAHTSQRPDIAVIAIAEGGGEDLIIAALRCGVRDYLKQPVSPESLCGAVLECIGDNEIAPSPPLPKELSKIIGRSRAIQQLRTRLAMVGQSECTALITGETGTGKELAAAAIHANSPRSKKNFVSLNCAAIPEMLLESELFGYERGAFTGATTSKDGKIREADGGTLFLDEIGELSLCAQAKILRAIETKSIQRLGGAGWIPVNFRVVAATNQNLEAMVERKLFRQDLYFRLNVARLSLPPLRERRDDVPDLLDFYLHYFTRPGGVPVRGYTAAVLDLLMRYDWPGNVRELKNTVEAMLIGRPFPRIDIAHLPEQMKQALSLPLGDTEEDDDRERLIDVLRSARWNKSKAAKSLRWSRMTLYRKMAKYGISDEVARAAEIESETFSNAHH